MLEAFTARPIVELKQRDKSKIESLVTHSDRLLVGLNNGSLRVYRVNNWSDQKPVDLLREEEKFSKYRVEQLAIIKEAKILLSLANSLVSLHDLSSYEFQESLVKSRGASAFAVTSNIVKDHGIPAIVSRLAVAVKRRLLLWAWQDSELVSEAEELTLVMGIKTLMWATGTRLVVGLNNAYVLVDVLTSTVTDIVGPGSIGGGPGQDLGRFGGVGVASMGYMGMGGMIPKPLATRLGEGQILLAKDINTHFMDSDGKPLGRRQIPWALAPEAIGYSYPFLLSLQAAKGVLEVRNPETLSALQTITLPNATQVHVPPPNVSLAHAGKGFLVSSDRCVWSMKSASYDDQIEALLEQSQYDEAISLLNLLEDALLRDKAGSLRETKTLKAQAMFDNQKYREALDEFRRAPASPQRVIALYPTVVSGSLQMYMEEEQSLEAKEFANDNPHSDGKSDDDASGQRDRGGTKRPKTPKSPKSPRDKKSPSSWKSSSSHKRRNEDSTSPKELDKDVEKIVSPKYAKVRIRDLEGKNLRAATLELASFLVESRTKLQRFLAFDGGLKLDIAALKPGTENHTQVCELFNSPPPVDESLAVHLQFLAKLVDTTLFRAYMLASPSMAGPLFRLPNFCDADVVKEKLLDTERYNDLVDFLYGKRLHEQALDLLARLGQEADTKKFPKQLQGPQRTVAYLQNLGPSKIDLILHYAEWPVRTDPKVGMGIFLADSENAETLPRDRVLAFLKQVDNDFVILYLEHIINELNDGTPEFHQALIGYYLDKLRSLDAEDKKDGLKGKILRFLKASQHYENWKVLRELSRDDPDMFEIRAVILGGMGEHRQALNIYVFSMRDAGKAEEYCNQVYVKQAGSARTQASQAASHPIEDGSPSIYQVLLSLYLSPPPPHEPQWGPALDILARHGSRLPAASSLGLIPEVLAVQKLEAYFTARLRAGNTILNNARITAGLRKTVDLEKDANLRLGEGRPGGHRGRNRNVVITEERVCGVCHKRFGGSAIKVLPDNSVVHYGCSRR